MTNFSSLPIHDDEGLSLGNDQDGYALTEPSITCHACPFGFGLSDADTDFYCVLCGGDVRMPTLPDLAARLEFDGWSVTIRVNGITGSPEWMRGFLGRSHGGSDAFIADHVAAAIVLAGRN